MNPDQITLDQGFMQCALDQARAAAEAGEVPVGAVVVHQGRIIASAHNSPLHDHDPCGHAEIKALRAAGQALGNYRLEECTLYVTLEPCAMCSGAALNARLKRVVYGAAEPKTGAAGSVLNILTPSELNHHTQLSSGVLAQECAHVLQTFFEQRRSHHQLRKLPLREDALRLTPVQTQAVYGLGLPIKDSHYTLNLPSLDGLRLHYLDNRHRTPSQVGVHVYLHGPDHWSAAFVDRIQGDAPCVAIDLPGFGLSDKPKKQSTHSLSWHAQVLHEFLSMLQIEDFTLVAPPKMQALLECMPQHLKNRIRWLDAAHAMDRAWLDAVYPDSGHLSGPKALDALLHASP